MPCNSKTTYTNQGYTVFYISLLLLTKSNTSIIRFVSAYRKLAIKILTVQ